MKLWIFSDLHRDFGKRHLEPPSDIDVIIAAGDIQDDAYLAELADWKPVVAVAGNHEFYGHCHSERLATLRSIPGVHFLENDVAEIDGVFFAGATLWTDYNRGDPISMETARRGMNDHRYIKWSKVPWRRFRPQEARQLHVQSIEFLKHLPADVIVTHHAPSMKSIHTKYEGQIINYAYASPLNDIVIKMKPKLWIHGHVHSNFDYMIGETRVLCNPHGYPGENPGFDPQLVVTL